jgi:hypothetical protein
MNKNYVFMMAAPLFLVLIVMFPGAGIGQDSCDNSNLMTATQQIFYCPMMGGKPSVPAAQLGPFPNTKWKISSIIPKPEKAFKSISFSFQPDGTMVETTEEPDGKIVTSTQKYQVQGATMLLSKPGANTNIRFRIDGNTMLVDTGVYSIILEKMN